MSYLKMKSVNKEIHTITGVTFVVDFNDFVDDEIIVKYMVTEDDKQICYLDFVGNTLKIKDVKFITC